MAKKQLLNKSTLPFTSTTLSTRTAREKRTLQSAKIKEKQQNARRTSPIKQLASGASSSATSASTKGGSGIMGSTVGDESTR